MAYLQSTIALWTLLPQEWGENSIVICAQIGPDVFELWRLFFLDLHIFFGPCTGWGNLETALRCMQEVVDAGKRRILKQQTRKKWWRGQRGLAYIYSQMDAGSGEAHQGKGKLDIETK